MIKKHWKKILIIMLIVIVSASIGAVYADYILNATEVTYNKEGNTIAVNTALDELYAKAKNAATIVYSQGQLVTYNGEPFYSLYDVASTDTTMELFAKTNLNSGATAQANEAYGSTACAFSSSQYWGNWGGLNFNLMPEYVATDAIGKARSYARIKRVISGRLLTKQEVEQMTGVTGTNSWSSITNTAVKNMLKGAGNSQGFEHYWLGTGEYRSEGLWAVYGEGSFVEGVSYDDPTRFGVRPVLNVYKSEVSEYIDPTAGFGAVNDTYKGDFGKKVTGYNVEGTWRLFYADSSSAYLIRNSIGNKTLRDLPGWRSSTLTESNVSELGKNLNGKFTAWNAQANNNNLKGVAALLDTTKWTEYAEEGVATWAIGAPTLEMFVASYNATHTIQIDSKVGSATATGYMVGKNESGGTVTSYDYAIDNLGNTSPLDKAIYCSNSANWWLASPSAYSSSNVMIVYYSDSGRLFSNYYLTTLGVRPLVSVPISKINNGITITENY